MATLKRPSALVSVEGLAEHIAAPDLLLLDASMGAPASGDLAGQAANAWIPRTQLFDFDKKICDQKSSLPHMLPSADFFTAEVQKLGINKDSLVVVYDKKGVYSSPRGWWMFRAMGHSQVAVLNGGLPAWQAAGHPCTETLQPPPAPGSFSATCQPKLIRDATQVLAALSAAETDVIDARSQGRFHGQAPEPREGLRPGHMPHALNLPFDRLVKDGHMLPVSQLQKVFAEQQISKEQQLIFSCGSSVTACILALGAELAGYANISVYDG